MRSFSGHAAVIASRLEDARVMSASGAGGLI
jgi:hypothetical protein